MTEDQRIAWCAGLFEGEGCISTTHQVHLKLTMVDEDVIRRFQEWIGSGSVTGPYRLGHARWRPIWTWRTGGKTAAVSALQKMLPFLNERRAAKGRQALELLEQVEGWDERRQRQGLPCGVYRRGNRYRAAKRIHGKFTALGTYDTPEEALQAWKEAA